MEPAKYKRIVLKLSGESLAGDQGFGINPAVVEDIAKQIKKIREHGVDVAIVVGGGNIWRGLAGSAKGMDRSNADYIGMLATVMNAVAVQDALDMMSFKCGLGFHRYSFELGKVATATEYTGSRQDLVQNANKNQIPIETALIGILRATLWAAKNLLGADVDPDTSISVNWDDSYIVSEQERTAQLREDALAGLVPRCRYLSARYGLSEDEAHQWAAEAKADSQTDEQLTFGGA